MGVFALETRKARGASLPSSVFGDASSSVMVFDLQNRVCIDARAEPAMGHIKAGMEHQVEHQSTTLISHDFLS